MTVKDKVELAALRDEGLNLTAAEVEELFDLIKARGQIKPTRIA